jgi:acyl-CoA reductase-like NAD-dependent aldehyde dehydrogenase
MAEKLLGSFDFWEEELSPDQEEVLLERAAVAVEKRKMVAAAILVLEMHKPLAYVAANATVTFAPFIVPFLGYDAVHDYSRLLKKPGNVERLIQKLERAPTVKLESD